MSSSQATDNVALLPDLSGTIIESNAVFFEGPGFFLRPKGAKPSALGQTTRYLGQVRHLPDTAGGGIGVDCNGDTTNRCPLRFTDVGVASACRPPSARMTTWDVALKYAADWNNFKVSAAIGYSQSTDETYIWAVAVA